MGSYWRVLIRGADLVLRLFGTAGCAGVCACMLLEGADETCWGAGAAICACFPLGVPLKGADVESLFVYFMLFGDSDYAGYAGVISLASNVGFFHSTCLTIHSWADDDSLHSQFSGRDANAAQLLCLGVAKICVYSLHTTNQTILRCFFKYW